LIWRKFRRHRVAVVCFYALLLLYFVVFLAEFFAPHGAFERHSNYLLAPPTPIRFIDDQGVFHLQPFVYPMSNELDRATFQRTYVEDTRTRYVIRLFVQGEPYKLFGFIDSNIHLVGVDEPGIFLPFGTDSLGRDLLSRMLLGARTSLFVGLLGLIIGFVLGLFFGLGMALFTVVQRTKTGNAAGLSHFIFGKAASMVAADVWLIGVVSVVIALLCCGVFKEFSLLCFDEEFAAARGYRTALLDWLLTLMAVTVTLIGLQSVGLLLVVALLLIPPTAARFWTNDLKVMAGLAAAIGGVSCAGGVVLSAASPKLAAGAVIVLTGAGLFVVSLVFGKERGLWPRWRSQRQFERRIGRSDLLRACYELLEPILGPDQTTQESLTKYEIDDLELSAMRQWPTGHFHGLVSTAVRESLLVETSAGGYQLTQRGAEESRDAVRRHRLWEIYLLTQTDLDPRLVDRGADGIEHVLDPQQLADLERQLVTQLPQGIPPSPHPIASAASS
ncbi:MAG: metal ABC transporter permease, partial [Planctomycetaceae bacterium]|nr:metal ABC transporter permease [Planctomycetaceae bacterium]